jgi:NTP pyrophosphatase (non-canonical NTP hydrolase)
MEQDTTYTEKALRTESKPKYMLIPVIEKENGEVIADLARMHEPEYKQLLRAVHAVLGLASEVGEVADALKRKLFYNKPLDPVHLQEELGDINWYGRGLLLDVANQMLIAEDQDLRTKTPEEIDDQNIAKLRARYPEKFTEEQALNRDHAKERAALES